MQAMVLEQPAPIDASPLKAVTWPDPEPGPGEIRMRVRRCAICRTDLHVIEGDLPQSTLPIVPGHQVVGEVDRLGDGVEAFALGDRVGIAWLRGTCGACPCCARGSENLCERTRFTGYHDHGGYAQHAVVRADFAYAIPVGFDDDAAAPLLCAGIIGYRALRRADPRPGSRLLLVGFGSSAHLVMQIALARGHEVSVATRGAGHQKLARQMGAAWVGEHPSEMPEKVDHAIHFAPVGDLVPPILEKLHRGGSLAMAGIHMTDVPALNYQRHLFYERDMRSVTCNTRADGRDLLAEAAAIGLRPHTTLYDLKDANRALQDLKADRINGTGVLAVG